MEGLLLKTLDRLRKVRGETRLPAADSVCRVGLEDGV